MILKRIGLEKSYKVWYTDNIDWGRNQMDMTYDVKDLANRYPDVEKLRVGNLRRAWRNIVL